MNRLQSYHWKTLLNATILLLDSYIVIVAMVWMTKMLRASLLTRVIFTHGTTRISIRKQTEQTQEELNLLK